MRNSTRPPGFKDLGVRFLFKFARRREDKAVALARISALKLDRSWYRWSPGVGGLVIQSVPFGGEVDPQCQEGGAFSGSPMARKAVGHEDQLEQVPEICQLMTDLLQANESLL